MPSIHPLTLEKTRLRKYRGKKLPISNLTHIIGIAATTAFSSIVVISAIYLTKNRHALNKHALLVTVLEIVFAFVYLYIARQKAIIAINTQAAPDTATPRW